MMSESGKKTRVLITGASSGIGEASAYRFAREGDRLALMARRIDRLETVAARVRELGGEALVLPGDVASTEVVATAVARVVSTWGGLDVLVNNAGFGVYAKIESVRDADLRRIFDVNVFGALYAIQAVVPQMKRQGQGVIINISSVVGKRALPMTGIYCATKFALQGLSESLRLELKGTGVDVSVICPGYTLTEFSDATVNYGYERRRPRGKVMSAPVVADVVFRCSRQPRREVILTPAGKFLVGLNRYFPRVADWLLGRYMRIPEEEAAGQSASS